MDKQFTHDPKSEGSYLVIAGTGRKIEKKVLVFGPGPIGTIEEQFTHGP
jgi:hypothetical protein